MSWPEIKEVVAEKRVVLIPIGSTEQHGPHLPTKTDVFIAYNVSVAVAKKYPKEIVVMPPVNYGLNEHHMDFPGTIQIDYETLIKFVIDIGKSVAHHGFEKLIIVNGHGSNVAPMELAAVRITLESGAICASAATFDIAPTTNLIKAEDSHAGDIETSIMLFLDPSNVDTSKAVRDWDFPESPFIKFGEKPGDIPFPGAVIFRDWWSRMSTTGTLGDPTKADPERGRKAFEMAVDALSTFAVEFRKREIRKRIDYH